MKKIISLILSLALLFALVACAPAANNDTETENQTETIAKPGDSMSLSDLVDSIIKDVENLPMSGNIDINEENFKSFLFIDYIDGAEALASESMMGAVAHSVVLLRLPDGSDVDAVATSIRENADPRKWICVGAEKTIVSVHGQTILLVMSSTASTDAISANFDSFWA